MAVADKRTTSPIDEILERDFDKATKAGEEAQATEPRAKTAEYDQESNRLVVELRSGIGFYIPIGFLQRLESAAPEDIAEVEITPSGYGLHWEKLDVDFTVTGLVAGIFGTKAWMIELGKKGGRSTSKAKSMASRENGKKGGRPRKTTPSS